MDGAKPSRGAGKEKPDGRLRGLAYAIGATGLLYAIALVGFLAMVWTLFQLLIWVFTG